jgi:hypothetical protein
VFFYIQEGFSDVSGMSIIKEVLQPQEPFAEGLLNLSPRSIKPYDQSTSVLPI